MFEYSEKLLLKDLFQILIPAVISPICFAFSYLTLMLIKNISNTRNHYDTNTVKWVVEDQNMPEYAFTASASPYHPQSTLTCVWQDSRENLYHIAIYFKTFIIQNWLLIFEATCYGHLKKMYKY